jgi:uncharacterized protein YbbC (DUF1343 family)
MKLGIEVLLDSKLDLLRGAKVGAVVHPASVLSSLDHTADALAGTDGVCLAALFGPQHGARGEKQDNMIESDFYCDPDTGIPVYSLYSQTRKPTGEMMSQVDILLFDLQDVGTRVYTFIWTLNLCMEACAESGKKLIVLDRPNPINGIQVEGDILDPAYKSFVGLKPIPMRHGMTVGELAQLFNAEFKINCDLTVVPMEGWHRNQWFDETCLFYVPPSPNLPLLDSVVVYPGMVLVEGTMLSEGRGTTRPFEFIGAPYIKPRQFADRLNQLALPGVFFRPAYFEPTFQKWAGTMCGGVQVHVLDRGKVEPYLTGAILISTARQMYPECFEWRKPPYEYEYEKLPIEILCGGRGLVDLMEKGASAGEIREFWKADVERFRALREQYLLYR